MRILSLLIFLVAFTIEAAHQCPNCDMKVKEDSKTHFEASKDGKELHFCSFVCAHFFHRKFKSVPLFVHDYNTTKKLKASDAYFLIKSKELEKELSFGMPPAVVAFADKAQAEKLKLRLKGGVVLKGFEEVENAFK